MKSQDRQKLEESVRAGKISQELMEKLERAEVLIREQEYDIKEMEANQAAAQQEREEQIEREMAEVIKLEKQLDEAIILAKKRTSARSEPNFFFAATASPSCSKPAEKHDTPIEQSHEMLKLAIELGLAGMVIGALVALAVVVLSPLFAMATPIIATTATIGFGVFCAVRASQKGFFNTSINKTEKQYADVTISDDLASCAP